MTVDLDEIVRQERAKRIKMVDETLGLFSAQIEADINVIKTSIESGEGGDVEFLLRNLIRNYFHAGYKSGDHASRKDSK